PRRSSPPLCGRRGRSLDHPRPRVAPVSTRTEPGPRLESAVIRRTQSPRTGAVVPMVAVLIVLILAMVAFAVDIGYICVVQKEMQNAADSAALAGASQL